MKTNRSEKLFNSAQVYMPGGVNSPVRAFRSVGGKPLFIKRGKGSRIYDEDGNSFIDYVCSWGPLILGHAHPAVVKALKNTVQSGTSFGASTEKEIILADMINKAMPSMEMMRFVNSGTEATMSAIRLARAFTGRDMIVKFAGCYHGHSDGLLAKAGSGLVTLSLPESPGVPASYTKHTLIAPYNDLAAVKRLFEIHGRNIACVIIEPVAANMGTILPLVGFLQELRSLTKVSGALLIFDEVITGFRVALGGAQSVFGVTPDLTCLGKIIGGGLPVGVYGGRRDVMDKVAPNGPVYQAGTLSGNPLAVTAGIETLKALNKKGVYKQLAKNATVLVKGLNKAAQKAQVSVRVAGIGSIMTVFFASKGVIDLETAKLADTEKYNKFFWAMMEQGIYLAPSQFEAMFLSLAHSKEDIAHTIKSAEKAFLAAK
ncbi:glutamate-1-semialdehyde 2,1-aminomutase [Elusimicrobiota bacterium]